MATKIPRKSSSQARASSTADFGPVDHTTAYARGVVDGRIIAGPHVRDACARHLRDMEDGHLRGLTFHPALADRAFRFFETVLRLTGGDHEAVPFVLIDWQKFIVGSLFGWLGADGYRRFRTAFVETGKGSGKSPIAAGVGNYMMMADGEKRAEIYAAAVDKEQAGILFKDAVAQARMSPSISSRVTFSGGEGREYNIAFLGTHSFFRPISSESQGRGKSGYRPHCVLLDEIHEHPTNAMVEFMRGGTKGRTQALIFMITNSGYDRASVCFEYHTYGAQVCSGDRVDDRFFAYICAVDEDDDPINDAPDPELGYPRSWAKSNPSIGVTFQPTYLEEQVTSARGMPSKESIVRRLNFCQWVDAANPWVDGDLWRACERADIDIEALRERPCYLGLDLSEARDLTALVAVWPDDDGGFDAASWFWTPRDTMKEREGKDRVPYSAWARDGHMEAVPGRYISYDFVVQFIADNLLPLFNIQALAYDTYKIKYFFESMNRIGLDYWEWDGPGTVSGSGICMVRHSQGFSGGASDKALWMPASIAATERAVMGAKLRVKKNPVLTWNSASAVLEADPTGNKKWEKRKSTGRIDGIVSLSEAVGCATVFASVETGSVYDTEGVMYL